MLAVASLALAGSSAQALTELDLVTTPGSSGSLNGALFYEFGSTGAGAGSIDEFVRYQAASSAITEGYNTDASPCQYDEGCGTFTHSILLSDVPLVDIGGTVYREFAFDGNESGSTAAFLSLDAVQLYVAGAGNLLGHPTFGGSATLVYDLDALDDSRILLEPVGGGQLDMLMYVPDSLFTAVGTYGADPFVYLYSRVGEKAPELDAMGMTIKNWGNSDGQEAWALSLEGGVGPQLDPAIGMMVPEPGILLMLGTGLSGLFWIGRRGRG